MIWMWIFGVIVILFGFVVFRGAPYVPSRKRFVHQAFTELYPLGPKDVLVDVGSGDGVVLRQAAELGARAVGYELNPILVQISKWLSRRYSGVEVRLVDAWMSHFPDDTTVVYVFAVTRDIKRVISLVQREADRIGKTLYVISYGNVLPGMKADKHVGGYHLYSFYSLQ